MQVETNEIIFNKGRIRFGEKARMGEFEPTEYIEFEMPANVNAEVTTLEIWIRTFLPGLNGSLAALGGLFVPNNTGVFQARIGVMEDVESESASHIGLPPQFANAIANTLHHSAVEHGNFVSGIFTVDRAEHHDVYSNNFVFCLLALAIASLLQNGRNIPRQEEVDAWFDRLIADITTGSEGK